MPDFPITIGKIMPVSICDAVQRCPSSPNRYADDVCRYGTKPKLTVAKHALAKLEEARAADEATHAANKPALANNAEIAHAVKAMMAEIGIPEKVRERDEKSRSRYPKMVMREAGYLADLRRHVKIGDGYDLSRSHYATRKQAYDAFLAEAQREADAAQAESGKRVEREKAERRANLELAALILRHDLDLDATWGDVLQALRAKDQRADLAVAMMATRGDWSEGAYRVADALHRFTITTDEEKDIVANVAVGLVDFDDGRVFRDCAWNYTRLLDSVADRQLADDVALAYERAGGSEAA